MKLIDIINYNNNRVLKIFIDNFHSYTNLLTKIKNLINEYYF